MLIGAKKAREVVFTVLRDACMDGDLSTAEAIAAVRDIFSENAKKFYKINIAVESLNSKIDQSPSFAKVDSNSETQDVTLVRILWIDASGQHRCRVRSFVLLFNCYATLFFLGMFSMHFLYGFPQTLFFFFLVGMIDKCVLCSFVEVRCF